MTDDEEAQGGRVFFSSAGRSLEGEDEIRLTSVGVDIGSSTSHLVFSRLLLERLDNRYVVTEREVFHESDVLLTPYAADMTIDADKLGAFVAAQYKAANVEPDAIDTGALILTGVAVRRRNARAIGELFAAQAGKFVSVSAGDALETTLAAFGSGAAARSIRDRGARDEHRHRRRHVEDRGVRERRRARDHRDRRRRPRDRARCRGQRRAHRGGRQALCSRSRRRARDRQAAVARPMPGRSPSKHGRPPVRSVSAKELSKETASLLRVDALKNHQRPEKVSFSGGVSEYIYGREPAAYRRSRPAARRCRARPRRRLARRRDRHARPGHPRHRRRRLAVHGAGVGLDDLRHAGLDAAAAQRARDHARPAARRRTSLSPGDIAAAIKASLRKLDLHEGHQPVALCYRWDGSATFQRLDDFCAGVALGLEAILGKGHPLVLVGDSDVGGLVGIHAHEEAKLKCPIVSIDGVNLKEFDFVDIGAMLPASGAVPVVIKSLVFPTSTALGRVTA